MQDGKALQEALVWASYGLPLHVRQHTQAFKHVIICASEATIPSPSMFADYGFILSPNQTPRRDMYFLEKLLGLGADDGVAVNIVFTRLCWLMGVWPAVYASLLLPTAKSGNKVNTRPHA